MKNYMFVTAVGKAHSPARRDEFAREIVDLCAGYTLLVGRGGWINPKTCAHESDLVDVWHVGASADKVPALTACLRRYLARIGEQAAYMVYPDGAATLIFAEDGKRPAFPLSDVPTPVAP